MSAGRLSIPPSEFWRQELASGRLVYQRCESCQAVIFYPRVICLDCGGSKLGWAQSRGRGTVYATTTLHPRGEEPYNVALIDLEESFRMMSRVEGLAPTEVTIGLPVKMRIVNLAGGEPSLVFDQREA